MGGIIGSVAQRDIAAFLLDVLLLLELHGYDCAFLDVLDFEWVLIRLPVRGKLRMLSGEAVITPVSD
ncbi:glutamine--fructose-6-phosphate aminotransferase, partial [Morganella morganii]|nr:glutamine--fructose-6-phosphate aminotransferase [Morganella morganii]